MKTTSIALAALAFATIAGTAAFAGDIDHNDQLSSTVQVVEGRQAVVAAPTASEAQVQLQQVTRDAGSKH